MIFIWDSIKGSYNFRDTISYFDGDYEFVKGDGRLFFVSKVDNIKMLNNIFSFVNNSPFFYKIVNNKFNRLFTCYDNNCYILVEYENRDNNIYDLVRNYNSFKTMLEGQCKWRDSWIDRSDYIQKLYSSVIGKYAIIDESIDYYYGMLEFAIYYLRDSFYDEYLYIQHCYCKFDKYSFYNPSCVKLDIKERDFSNYIKYLFFSGMYEKVNIVDIINDNIDRYDFNFVIGRLIYPDYYFDLFDKLVCYDCICESELDNIIEDVCDVVLKVYEYEKYIVSIYDAVSLKKDIKKVDFFNLH